LEFEGTVKTLAFPDQHHLNAALGWLALGNLGEARLEAERISLLGRAHQDAFLVRWRIASRTGQWSEAHRLADVHTRTWPNRAVGWICLSYSLFRLGRPLEAWMQLLPRVSQFPRLSAIPYILACYAWQLGQLQVAREFLRRSAALGGPAEIRGIDLDSTPFDDTAFSRDVRRVPG
jgi:hypothetical protein